MPRVVGIPTSSWPAPGWNRTWSYPYSQALAKIERRLAQDRADVAQRLDRGLVEPQRLRDLFEAIEPRLHRYPAVDPRSFRKRLDEVLRSRS